MILIVSHQKDRTTNIVCDWLDYFGAKYDVVNTIELIKNKRFEISNTSNFLSGYNIGWYRRDLEYLEHYSRMFGNVDLEKSFIIDRARQEINLLRKHLFSQKSMKWLSPFEQIDKIQVLEEAINCNIKVPCFLITNSRKRLEQFINEHEHVIYKPITECSTIISDRKILKQKVSDFDLDAMVPDFFFPSLFQEKIDKVAELRVFVLGSKIFAGRIRNKRCLDVREILNKSSIERCSLSKDMEQKIHRLMKRLNLNTGSIDLLEDQIGNTYLLEINPIGHFSFLSKKCNYSLEKEVAQYLIKHGEVRSE